MATAASVCGICASRKIVKLAVVWCSECYEELCVDCQDYHGLSTDRKHKTIPITECQGLPVNISDISDYCNEHNEKFQLFCKQHERPCCELCAANRHRKCVDMTAIDSIACFQNVKTSNTFQETENLITEILKTIDKIRKNKTDNLSSVQEKRQMMEKEILAARTKINKHLDQIQETLMKDLTGVETNVQKETTDILTSLNAQEKQLNDYKITMSSIKEYGTDLQTFLSIHRIGLGVVSIDTSMNNLLKTDSMKNTSLSCQINTKVQQFQEIFPSFGQIIIQSHPFQLPITREEHKQAQIMVSTPSSCRSIDNISLELQQMLNTHGRGTRGCSLFRDGRMAFSFYGQNRVRLVNKDGSQGFDNGKVPNWTFDIAYINDTNTMAVTSGGSASQCISIINLETGKIEKAVNVGSFCYGIVYKNNTLVYCVEPKGLCMLNLKDGSVSDVFGGQMSMCAYVATNNNRFYYTDDFRHTVTCCILHGTVQWRFKNENMLKWPSGITVDNEGNVYVVGKESCNVVVISPDGQHGRQLLGEENGLFEPTVLDYDTSTNRLLVVNKSDIAFLFQVAK